ncbi:MAG TPA: homoserine kinase [Gemmatimonadales bacterium]|jgi:homoserine kinase
MITVRVPGSTSNLGAGFDCLGLALDVWIEVRAAPGAGPFRYSGTVADLDAADDLIAQISGPLRERDVHLEIDSRIPVARGLGSSAAAIVAGLILAELLSDRDPDPESIFRAAAEREGHPDNAGPAIYGGLILSTDRPERLALSPELGVALAIPDVRLSTKTARDILPGELARDTAIAQASGAAALLLGLTTGNGDLIGFGMDDRIATPHRRHLIRGFEAAVEAGRRAGAYGVTISGAGPALLAITALVESASVARAMADALTAAGNPAHPLAPNVTTTGASWTTT